MLNEIIVREFNTQHEAIQHASCFDPRYWDSNIVCVGEVVELILIQKELS